MATINATINVNSDITSYPITINKTMTMKKAGTCNGLEKTLGLSSDRFTSTDPVVLELAADATASKACKVYIRNTGSSKANFFWVALNASAAAATTEETLGKLYGGDWMLIPWEANGTGHNITVAPSTAEVMTIEWMAFVE